VWTVQYEASPSNWLGSAMALPDRAANLLAWLEAERLCDKKLVFIAHSLGGLVVKQLLRLSADRPGTPVGRLIESTKGVVFLATPNTGSDLASWMDRLRALLGTSLATKDLQADSAYLRDLNGWYRQHGPAEDISTLVFAETRVTKGLTVVEQSSADPGIPGVLAIPVDADHLSIAKPANRDQLVFKRIKAFIEENLPTTPLAPTPQSAGSHSRRFFLSYRRSAKEDAGLAQLLYQELRKAGHDVFIDVQMTIGTDWARRIEERIDWCDFLVVMLSAESINSEMVQEEVRLAHQRRKRNGAPFILPIRVRYDGPLGYALGAYIERYQYATWKSDHDTPAVLAQILEASRTGVSAPVLREQGIEIEPPVPNTESPTSLRPVSAADPRLLKQPGGALGLDDPAYIARAIDSRV
jgi:pimeloyl-ACP methyl ester carboxylesterase